MVGGMRRYWSIPLLLLPLASVGCGGGDDPGGPACRGDCAIIDFDAELATPEHFFDAPYPSDLRLDADGHPMLEGFPNPKGLVVVEGLVSNAAEATGFPMIPVAHFRFSKELSPRVATDLIAADASSPVLLLDVDETSPDHGKLVPAVADTPETDNYVPEFLLSVAPWPGFVLRPKTRYAVVVRTSANDSTGAALSASPLMARLAKHAPKGKAEQAADAVYAPLWPVLDGLGVAVDDVAAATVFTTGDVVADQFELSTQLVEKYDLTIDGLTVEADSGAPDLCILRGSIDYPQFQKGVPSFQTEGRFEMGADGLPVEQRTETAPVVIVLPKVEMPAAGYPLVLNIHGSGGWSIAMVRPVADDGLPGEPIGPAFPYAFRGFAVAGSAMPLNPERKPGAQETEYLNSNNLAAMRDTFRQGQIEQRLFIEALSKLEIDPSVVSSCAGVALPAGATKIKLDPKSFFVTGQSMGGMYTNQVAAIEPLLRAAVPTGAGGLWTQFILHTPLNGGAIPGLLKIVLSSGPLTMLHPVLGIGAAALEPADPIVFAPRIARRPLPGHPIRPIYEPMATNDSYFPEITYNAMVLAYGHRQAGDAGWPEMQSGLALAGLDGLLSFPVTNDVTSDDGAAYTGVAIQFPPTSDPGGAPVDGHAIYVYRDDEKYQYSCFMKSVLDSGKATVPVPVSDWKAACP